MTCWLPGCEPPGALEVGVSPLTLLAGEGVTTGSGLEVPAGAGAGGFGAGAGAAAAGDGACEAGAEVAGGDDFFFGAAT